MSYGRCGKPQATAADTYSYTDQEADSVRDKAPGKNAMPLFHTLVAHKNVGTTCLYFLTYRLRMLNVTNNEIFRLPPIGPAHASYQMQELFLTKNALDEQVFSIIAG